MVIKNLNFRKLEENEEFIIGHIFEDAYLIEKKTKKELYLGDFYGDPTCALISSDNSWCLVAGEGLVCWRRHHGIMHIKDDELKWIHEMKQIGPYDADFLIDPFSEKAAIWRFNIMSSAKQKLKDIQITPGDFTEIIW